MCYIYTTVTNPFNSNSKISTAKKNENKKIIHWIIWDCLWNKNNRTFVSFNTETEMEQKKKSFTKRKILQDRISN